MAALPALLNDKARQMLTLVPVSPSKAKTDPLYDDRLIQVLHGVWPGQAADLRELIVQPVSTAAVHDREDCPTPAELEVGYVIDQGLLQAKPQLIAVVDDMVTTGAHFVVIRNMPRREFPGIKIVGIFITKRVCEAVDAEDFEL